PYVLIVLCTAVARSQSPLSVTTAAHSASVNGWPGIRPVPVTVTFCPSISRSTGDTARVVMPGSAPPLSPGLARDGAAVTVAPMSTHAPNAQASLVRDLARPILAILGSPPREPGI